MTAEEYRARLVELGQLAARLEGDPNDPIEIIFDFYGITGKDREIVLRAYQEAPILVRRPIMPTLIPMPDIDWSKVTPGEPIYIEPPPQELIDGIKLVKNE